MRKVKIRDILHYGSMALKMFHRNLWFPKENLYSVCFSGHRDSSSQVYDRTITISEEDYYDNLKNAIEDSIKNGFNKFYTGCCSGFDIVAGEIVLELKKEGMQLHLCTVVPFKKQAYTFTDSWKKRYDRLLSEADEYVLIQKKFSKGCYQRRNEYMADRSSLLICYFLGNKGGTKNTVEYCKKLDLEIVNVAD